MKMSQAVHCQCPGFGTSVYSGAYLYGLTLPVSSGRRGSLPLSTHPVSLFILFVAFSRQEYWSGLPFLSQSILKEISPECSLERLMLKWNSNTLATWSEELTHWKRPWCWERMKERGEGDSRGWNGWMASPIQWTWVWVDSGSWWWTGRPGVLQFMGLQRVRHDWATGLNWTVSLLHPKALIH